MKRTKLLSILLSAALVFSLSGCGGFSIETTSATIPSGNEKPVAEEVIETAAGPTTTVDDFYSYVNADWLAENTLPANEAEVSWMDSAADKLYENTKALLEKTSKDSFEADTAEYKMLSFYEQLLNADGRTAADASLASIMNQIQSASSLSQVYNLMKDDTLSLFDRVMDTQYLFTDGATYRICVMPSTIMGDGITYTEQEKEILVSGFSTLLTALGMSADRASSVATNAIAMNQKIVDFYQSIPAEESGYVFYNHENWEEAETTLPFFDILKARGLSRYEGEEGDDEYGFFTIKPYFAFMNALCTNENAEMLRDYLTVAAVYDLFPYASEGIIAAAGNMSDKLCGVAEASASDITKQSYGAITSIDQGVLANLYAAEYISMDLKKEIKKYGDNIKTDLLDIIKNAEGFKANTRGKMQGKPRLCTILVGTYDERNDYADMTVGSNTVETAISVMKSNRAYEKATKEPATEKVISTDYDFFTVNAKFDGHSDTVYLGAGVLLLDATTDEEKMGTIGYIIAHEYAHAFDSNSVQLLESGVFQNYLSEDQLQVFYDKYNAIAAFFDNVETPYGNVRGSFITNETYSDILALQVCVDLLSQKKGGADFDAFFKAYARYYAASMTTELGSLLYRADTHLPGDLRVNCVLTQIDKFYEIYDIPEGSPYYVAPENRLKAF